MKKSYFFNTALAVTICLGLGACGSENRTEAETETTNTEQVQIGTEELDNETRSLRDVIVSREELSTFGSLIESAGMVETIDGVGPFTVFAPSNDAFNNLPQGRLAALQNMGDSQELKTIIGHHMMSRRLTPDEVEDAGTVDMLGGPNLHLRTENGNIMIGNARVVTQSIPARNGVIHIIDQVLIPENVDVPQ
ncbi:fasciclin domain-containing protein [Cesiribacter sp. SM1]|uniref:fasciclin domain-containing protein n=1 Tax=Cesiribacter sp. SM1 TaxID=2861196 RepID=UPI001CD2C076|nr:fasciclin domain-containing protein [Cesiribacter sp. SM1]